MNPLYNLGMRAFDAGISLGALKSEKIKKLRTGQKEAIAELVLDKNSHARIDYVKKLFDARLHIKRQIAHRIDFAEIFTHLVA